MSPVWKLAQKYYGKRRSLLSDAEVEEIDAVEANVASGAHLTVDCILRAPKCKTIRVLS